MWLRCGLAGAGPSSKLPAPPSSAPLYAAHTRAPQRTGSAGRRRPLLRATPWPSASPAALLLAPRRSTHQTAATPGSSSSSSSSSSSAAAQAAVDALRADPVLSKILDRPRVQAAIKEVQKDPGALRRYIDDADVMKVLTRLLDVALPPEQVQAFAEMNTSPSVLATTMFAHPELSRLLQKPAVAQALAAAGSGDSDTLEAMAASDPDVARALEILEQGFGL